MYSTHEAELDLPSLPMAARRVHIVPALSTASLLSMGQLCDAGCHVTFDAAAVNVYHHDRIILSGNRAPTTGLWHLNLVQAPVVSEGNSRGAHLPPSMPVPCPSSCAAVQ